MPKSGTTTHKVIGEDNNSIAVIMNHISGNLKSRFTNFHTEDGEKGAKPKQDARRSFKTKYDSISERSAFAPLRLGVSFFSLPGLSNFKLNHDPLFEILAGRRSQA